MPSKTSFFNPTLFKKNLQRFWPLWGGASLIGALVPLALLVELLQHHIDNIRSAIQPLEMTASYYYALSIGVPAISLIYAALCALVVWHYLYNARSVSMYHSLPITRKGLFATNVLSGMAMMLIPYAVTGILAVSISLAAGFFEPVGLLVTILSVIGLSFFYFASASLIAFFTGNPFAFAAFYFIFHFFAAGLEWLITELMTTFYFGLISTYEGVVEFLSPTLFLPDTLSVNAINEEITTPDGWIDSGDIISVTLENGWLIAVYALVGVVFLGCAWLLYRSRRSESAGDVVAVGWMKPIFRYGVALCAALTGGAVLYSVFCSGFQRRTTVAVVPMAVCMALAGIIGYYIASMLLAKSLKVFRGSGRGVLTTAIAAAALCAIIALDPAGVESWVPDAAETDIARVTFYGDLRNCEARLESPEDIQKVLDLHRAILAEKDSLNLRQGADGHNDSSVTVRFSYYFSDEKFAWRDYHFPYGEADLAQDGAVSKAAALVCDPAIQESNIFGEVYTRDYESIRITGGYISGLYEPTENLIDIAGAPTPEIEEALKNGGITDMDLSAEQAKVLEDAIRRDIQAGHFGRTVFMTDRKDFQNTAYYPDIILNYSATRQDSRHRGYTYSSNARLSISTYCTETVRALEEIGVLDEGRSLMTVAEYNARFQDTWDGYYDDYYDYYGSPYYSESIIYPDETILYPEDF